MEDLSTSGIIYLLVVVIITFLLYKAGSGKYESMIAPLPKEDYGLKDFFPIGFFVMDLIK